MKITENNKTEQHIIEVARQTFIEKGFAETSMSDIAARAGINRPGLHYYFRTKDRLFEAVFADIIQTFIPTIHQIVSQDKPATERISEIADVYFDLMQHNPSLPVFIIREIQRDADHLVNTVSKLETGKYVSQIKEVLLADMACGKLRKLPLEFVLYTFYGLLFAPFLSKPLTNSLFATSDTDFCNNLQQWKAQVIGQMSHLLCCD